MKNISLDLLGKIDPLLTELLREVDKTAKRLGLRFLVAGATARDIPLSWNRAMASPLGG